MCCHESSAKRRHDVFFFEARLKPQGRNLVIESGSHECMRILEKPFFLMLSEEGFCLGRCFGKAL